MKHIIQQNMRNLLIGTLVLTGISSACAATFDASGSEPFWSLSLEQQIGDQYQAVFSYAGETGIVEERETVFKKYHKGFTRYLGESRGGNELSIVTIKKNCVSDGKGDTLSHIVIVNEMFEGCGGDVLASEGESEQRQSVHKTELSEAKKLNSQGYNLYKQGKYRKALVLFNRARKSDRNYAVAHYNFACTASIISRKYQCLNSDKMQRLVTLDKVIEALNQSIRLDARRKAKSQTDPDLKALRNTYAYYRNVLHYSPNNNSQLRQILRRLDWTQAFGFYPHHGSPASIKFGSNTFTTTANNGSKKTGAYTLHHGLIKLTLGAKTATGRLVNEPDLGVILKFTGEFLPFNEFSAATRFGVEDCDN